MINDNSSELLNQAEQAFTNKDPRKGLSILHQILSNDFDNESAWKLLYRVMRAKEPFEVFQLEMTKKYFPKNISRLNEKLPANQIREIAQLQPVQSQQLGPAKEPRFCPQCGQEKIKDKNFCPNCGFNYSLNLAMQKEQGQKDEQKQPDVQDQQGGKATDGDSKSQEDLRSKNQPTSTSKRKPLKSKNILLLIPILLILLILCCVGGLVTQQKFIANIFAPIDLMFNKSTTPKDKETTVDSKIIGKWYKLQGMSDSIFAMDRDSEINFLQDGNFIIDAKGTWDNMQGTYSLSGNTLTINWPGIYANNVHSLNSAYEVIFAKNQMLITSSENGQLAGYSREKVTTQATPKIPDNINLPNKGFFLFVDGQPVQLEKAIDANHLSVKVVTSDNKPVAILNGIEEVQWGLEGIFLYKDYIGIGVHLDSASGNCLAASNTAWSNAEEAGLRNQYIISINGQPTNGDCQLVSKMLADAAYTTASLEVMDLNGNTSIVEIPVQTLQSETRLEFTFTKDPQNYIRLTPTGILDPGIYSYVYKEQSGEKAIYSFKVK